MPRPRIGLALGSGAARGWAHIGIIEALAELGIVPEIVCGTSIGALVGAAHAAGKLSVLKARIEGFGWRDIAGLLDVGLAGGGLIEGRRIESFVASLGVTGDIEVFPIRFGAVATDLVSGREVWLEDGPVGPAVRASIGVPGVFSPARDEARDCWLIDGGLVNPVPVSLARALGAEIIIAVDLNGDLLGRRLVEEEVHDTAVLERALAAMPPGLKATLGPLAARLLAPGPSSPSYFEVLANSLNIMQDRITRARLAGEPPHVLLSPRLPDLSWLDFHRAGEAIAAGRAAVEHATSALTHYCGVG